MNYKKRINIIRNYLNKEKTDALLIKDPSNIFYLTGILETEGFLLIDKDKTTLFLPALYKEEANQLDNQYIIEPLNLTDFKKVLSGYKRVSFIATELTYNLFSLLQKDNKTTFVATPDIIKDIRMIKEEEELVLIKKALSINHKVFQQIEKQIETGMRETEVAGEIHYLIRHLGGRKEAFEPIVASGLNSVYPHHRNSDRKIRKNQPLVIDAGTDYRGYKSDLTRTLFLGTPPKKLVEPFKVLQEVLLKTIEFVKPGMVGKEIHSFAVEVLKKNKLDKYFIHGLGHGVGIDVHEKPFLNSQSTDIIQKGCVLTIEPGIYIPQVGGMRLEEMLII
ncbi:Xaa-Pro peptidase family protein [bacterium]|nr:Xaa-Pro peptidase family protein [bacterium]